MTGNDSSRGSSMSGDAPSGSAHLPPSENESGVVFTTPMTSVWSAVVSDRDRRFQVIGLMVTSPDAGAAGLSGGDPAGGIGTFRPFDS